MAISWPITFNKNGKKVYLNRETGTSSSPTLTIPISQNDQGEDAVIVISNIFLWTNLGGNGVNLTLRKATTTADKFLRFEVAGFNSGPANIDIRIPVADLGGEDLELLGFASSATLTELTVEYYFEATNPVDGAVWSHD